MNDWAGSRVGSEDADLGGAIAPAGTAPRASLPFPVVGIGASAGGLEALETFFGACPTDLGMAYVVIQHLSPDHQSLMAEILGRRTSMPVVEVRDEMAIEPDRVYVIAPGRTLTLEEGRFRLGEPVEVRGHRRPVDDFFRSLAEVQKEKAIIVLLSGTGTNGTAGAQAVKAAGGICIAQNPDSAAFPGMPRSLIHAGYADQVLEANEIPNLLKRFGEHGYLDDDQSTRESSADALEQNQQRLREVLALLRGRTRHDFTGYRKPTLVRRIQRRMGLHGLSALKDYAGLLRGRSDELEALANDLMINVTGFLRDPEAWEALRSSVIAPLVERKRGDSIRAWVTACASGEEAYTLAIVLAEEIARVGEPTDVKIYATDTADKSLALARAGIFPGGIEACLSPERLERFFDKDEHTFRVKKEIRDMVVFAQHDLLRDPPFSRLDLATCRNLLIYLEPETQRRVLGLLHFALNDGAYLFLGSSESANSVPESFEVVSKRWRIFRRTGPSQHRFTELPSFAVRSLGEAAREPEITATARASATFAIQRALLERYGPPTAVVNRDDEVIYFHGDTDTFLRHPAGEPTRDLFELLRMSLRPAVRNALRTAVREHRQVVAREGNVDTAAGLRRVHVTAAPVIEHAKSDCFMVSFAFAEDETGIAESDEPGAEGLDVEAPVPARERHPEHDAEIRSLKRQLQSSIEAFEVSTQELKASNEEVTSVNEELQSANEELETGKEELQSLNEELLTVNTQLQSKIAELEGVTNDLTNLLSSTNIAVVFLDTQFRVRRFTPAVRDLMDLIDSDIGRPITDLARKFTDANLLHDAEQVLQKLIPIESEVCSASGRWYLRRVLPYRTAENHISGVVITFVDIAARKLAEQEILEARENLRAVLEQLPAAVVIAEVPSGKLMLANRLAATLLGRPFPVPSRHSDLATLHGRLTGFHPDGRLYMPNEWPLAISLASGEAVVGQEITLEGPKGTRKMLSVSSTPVHDSAGNRVAVVGVFWDITDRMRSEQSERDARDAAVTANNAKDEFIATVSHELRTPLNTIRLWVRMLETGRMSEEDRASGVRTIERAALSQQKLIDDLLDVSRIASGKMRLNLQRVRLADCILNAFDAVNPVANARGQRLEVHVNEDIGRAQADPDRVQQIVWNLLSNATKFTPKAGRIALAARRNGDDVEITVTDSGIGIAPEFLPHVFDKFRQADSGASRKHSGLGLGLGIVKQLVELHGGTIEITSAGEGKGTMCKVVLPLPLSADQESDSGVHRALSRPDLKGVDILLVEDEAATRETTRRLFESAGAAVRAVDSAHAAHAALVQRQPHVIVSDIGLPGEDGYTLLKEVRVASRAAHLARIPALALTAFARPDDRRRALEAGFDEHLAKPVDAEQLLAVVAQLSQKKS
jgi:two-component system, chemotaxis family, CheB/CheR fusion protein